MDEQEQIAVLRALAFRITHHEARHAVDFWVSQPRPRTTRFTLDIDTKDLRDLLTRIERGELRRTG